ncbi:transposase [Ktedonobacter racemifer]|uniref:transposase n=1 Tax=Ktedonobacter racemifer TaxID=363277 RepID=UPI00058D51D3|nr:transposase [Ktedonobacter racemifer]
MQYLARGLSDCPGSKVSAGKRLGGRTTQGNTHLQALLGEVAWAASHTKDTYLAAFYQRIARRRGKKKAVVALERKLLVIIYHMLLTKSPITSWDVSTLIRSRNLTSNGTISIVLNSLATCAVSRGRISLAAQARTRGEVLGSMANLTSKDRGNSSMP